MAQLGKRRLLMRRSVDAARRYGAATAHQPDRHAHGAPQRRQRRMHERRALCAQVGANLARRVADIKVGAQLNRHRCMCRCKCRRNVVIIVIIVTIDCHRR